MNNYYEKLKEMAMQLVVYDKSLSLKKLERKLHYHIGLLVIRGANGHLLDDSMTSFYFNYKGGQRVPMVRRNKRELVCRYCHNFFFAKKRYMIKVSEKRVTHERLCLEGNRVEGVETACEKFVPCERFWCEKSGYWITPGICMHRREIRSKYCKVSCAQFKKYVSLYIEEYKENDGHTNTKMTRIRRKK